MQRATVDKRLQELCLQLWLAGVGLGFGARNSRSWSNSNVWSRGSRRRSGFGGVADEVVLVAAAVAAGPDLKYCQ